MPVARYKGHSGAEEGDSHPILPGMAGADVDAESGAGGDGAGAGAGYTPLARRMQKESERRTGALRTGTVLFAGATRSSDPWLKTLLVYKARAVTHVAYPWLFINLVSVVWTLLNGLGHDVLNLDMTVLQNGYPLLMPTLGFLLVFRMNRAAVRFWDSRQFWGIIVAASRQVVDLSITHLAHAPRERDACIAWTCAFCVAFKDFLRGAHAGATPPLSEQLAGILTEEEAAALARSNHPGLYAAHRIRSAARRALSGRRDSGAFDGAVMRSIDTSVSNLVLQMGGCERVKGTPLPLVYVTHLRTYLTLALVGLPLVFESAWEWGTIPTVALISYAFLGLEGAASECDAPFLAGHVNHLNMDGYCMLLIEHVEGMLEFAEEEEAWAREGAGAAGAGAGGYRAAAVYA